MKPGKFEIGRILYLKSEICNWTSVQSEISDFGFEMGFCPISQFPPRKTPMQDRDSTAEILVARFRKFRSPQQFQNMFLIGKPSDRIR